MATGGNNRVGIRDVAEAANVSATTVSHALSGRGKVRAETRAKVEEVARRLGYQPSRAARTLRTSRTETLGLVLPEFETGVALDLPTISLDHYMRLTRSAALTAFACDYRLLISPPLSSVAEVDALGVDGAIICDPVLGDHQIDFFAEKGIPVVTHERPPGRPDFRWHVHVDNEAIIWRLLDHLAEAGGTKIAMIVPDLPSPTIGECQNAYLRWCEQRGVDSRLEVVAGRPEGVLARERVELLLASADRPDAILDVVPPSSLEACRRRGLRVPEDVLIAAFIDTPETRASVPAITASDLNPTAIGEAAVKLLIELIEGGSPVGPIIVPSPLHVRASSQR